VDALHPGYGFLSENADLADVCHRYGITFIGPTGDNIRTLGNKVAARALAQKADVPMLPGSRDVVRTPEEAESLAREIGLPIIIKAAAGGGGRGMRIVRDHESLRQQFAMAQNEALTGFGNSDVFIERYCENPRHVEIQILADRHGNMVHLGERDCSVQRRHQKLIEEAPSPVVTPLLRSRMGEAALKLARAAGYTSLGTVEFLVDEASRFYFMEVNTRVQVEHPVTESISDIDLVKEQIRLASGEPLSVKASMVEPHGHAIEFRVNAEDPVSFAPWPGRIGALHLPGGPGVRVDSFLYAGYTVPSLYDSLIAKVIVWGRDRAEALARARRALREMKVDGIRTNIPFHLEVLDHPLFIAGDYSTKFLERLREKR
jgi:acetyl-CoA carboxylase biotin carboxylase subunit